MRRPVPPLRLLTVFESVLRHKGVKDAAAELNVSQPAISQSLRQLEDFLGAKLLDRSTRPPRLTEAGIILQKATVESLGRISDAIGEIAEINQGLSTSVTIACSVGFATYWLMPRLAAFYERYPEISVNVLTTPQGAPQLQAGIDIAIRYGDGAWTDGAVTRLFSERIDPVCSPAFRARFDDPTAILDAAPLIHVEVDDERWLSWDRYLSATGASGRQKLDGPRFTNYVQAAQAALNGQGVMLGWRSITGDAVADGRLVRLPVTSLVPDDGFYLVSSSRAATRTSRELLAGWLVEIA